MSAKMKGLLAVLVLAMGLSVWYWSSVLTSPQVAETQQALALKTAAADDDGDGLSAREEAYWRSDPANPDTDGDGFLDGEEVMSGHNPIIKGPKDYLDAGQNITERTAALITGATLAGDLDPTSASYSESVQMISDAMVDQYRRNAAIVLDKVIQTADNTLETRGVYVGAMARLFPMVILPSQRDIVDLLKTIEDVPAQDPSVLTNDAKRYGTFATRARALSIVMGERAEKVAAVPVPRPFLTSHKYFLRVLRIAQKQLELAARMKEDPMQGAVAVRSLVTIADRSFGDYLSLFQTTMEQNLNP